MRSLTTLLAIGSLALALGGCVRHGSAGEACTAPGLAEGAFDQCAEGFTCTPDSSGLAGNGQSPHWDTATCRTLCSNDLQCPAHEHCRGVAGADYLMACQPD
jgi:hypothetical protein